MVRRLNAVSWWVDHVSYGSSPPAVLRRNRYLHQMRAHHKIAA